MKLTITLLLFAVLSANAGLSYSQTARINLKMNNVTLVDVFREIERTSEFGFFFKNEEMDLNRKVSIDLKNATIEEILGKILVDNYDYRILDKNIVVTRSVLNKTGQQQKTVSGKVTESSGVSIPGVTVLVKGTTNGTITDSNGQFTLSNIPANSTLQFSFVGMKSEEVVVGGKATINVTLTNEAVGIEEVVAIGYGTQKKINLTGSLSSIGEEKLKTISTSNLVTGLAGKLPGLRVTQWTGEPGSFSTAFDIRGFGKPLIVVDGIVRDDFTRFNPTDIANITILKDGSAAVYGVQAANGVILVTTKKGKIGKPVVKFSSSYDFQKFTVDPKLTNAYQFAVLTDENDIANGINPTSTTYSPQDIQNFKDGTYPSTDWLGAIQKNNSSNIRHNISISGGSEKVKYFASMGYLKDGGIWKSDNLYYKKYNMNSSVTYDITDNLKAQFNVDGILEDGNNTSLSADNIYFTAMLAQPTIPLYANNNPEYLQLVNPENVLADISADRSGYSKTKTKTFQSNMSLDYKFKHIDGLTARFIYGFYSRDLFQKDWRKLYNVYTYDKISDTYTVAGSGKYTPTSLYENYSPFQKSTVLGQLNYDKLFLKKHRVKAALIYEARHGKSENLNANKYFALDIDQLYAGLDQNATVSSSNIYEDANQSIIGRLNYDYSSKYLFEVGFNYGGSSKFPKGERWGLFPFTSFGWRVSEEKFIKENLPYVTNLKLRASIGKMGDDGAANFQFLTGYNYPNGNYIFGNEVIPALGFRGLPNPNITWFTATTKNMGIDIDIREGLISMQFDIFQRNRSGLLATRTLSLPATVGANLPQENLNSDQQNGFELVVGHRKKLGELSYDISANLSYTHRENLNIERAPDGNSYLNWRNNSIDRWSDIQWGYNYLGQYQTNEEILSSPIVDGRGNKTLRPGDLKYEDVNHDGMINDMDQVPIAKSNVPNINFALNISLAWRKFDMNVLFQGASDYSFQYQGLNALPLRWSRNSLEQFMDRWHHEDIFDVNSPLVQGYYPQTGYPDSNNWTSSFWLINGSYVRLKNVEIGYTIANSFLKGAGIQDVRFHVSGLNLYTLSNFKNMDPEQHYVNWVFYSYPINKSLSLGLNVTF